MTERIAVVTTSYPSFEGDPAGHFVETEVRSLAAQGARVTVLAPWSRSSRAPATGSPPCSTPSAGTTAGEGTLEVIRIEAGDAFGWPGALARIRQRPARLLSAAAFTVRCRRMLESQGPFERVIAHWMVPCGVPISVGRSPVEIVVHGSDARLVSKLPGPLRSAIAARLRRDDVRLRFVSRALAEDVARALGADLLERSGVEPSPIDMTGAPSRALAREALALGAEEWVIVIAGRLVPGKRIDRAITRALGHPGHRIVVLGDGPLREPLMRSHPMATFLGQVSRPQALTWIAAADLVVSASIEEGAPTVVREARALDVPVLAAATGDLHLVADTDPGLTLF